MTGTMNWFDMAMKILPAVIGEKRTPSGTGGYGGSGGMYPSDFKSNESPSLLHHLYSLPPPGQQVEPRQVTSTPSVFNSPPEHNYPPASLKNTTMEDGDGFLSQFFDKMDNNLQSPSKVIGLGLLNRADPRLAAAGLLAMGLLGGKKQ